MRLEELPSVTFSWPLVSTECPGSRIMNIPMTSKHLATTKVHMKSELWLVLYPSCNLLPMHLFFPSPIKCPW